MCWRGTCELCECVSMSMCVSECMCVVAFRGLNWHIFHLANTVAKQSF